MKHSPQVHIFVFGYSMMQHLKMYDISSETLESVQVCWQ